MNLTAKRFEELDTKELYEILKARAEIFIMEQNMHYQDMDNVDYKSLHCFFIEENKVIAYLRSFYQEDNSDIVRIGRVLTLKRGIGIGRELMEKSIIAIKEKIDFKKIIMDAQKYAVGFYEKFGFKSISSDFLEEGVLHVVMELEL